MQKESIKVIVFSINEFSVWPEGLESIISFAKKLNIKCVLVTNGFVSQQWQSHFVHHFDAIKIDLKSFGENSAHKTGIWLSPVITYIEQLRSERVWLELSLVVESGLPGTSVVNGLIKLANKLDILNLPIHLQRFLPAYRLVSNTPPSIDEMQKHRDILMHHGFAHVYISNVAGIQDNNTICPSCKSTLITRTVKTSTVHSLVCQHCTYTLPGHFSDQGTQQ
jgi:pyruvate formate lyase activating enzyme